MAAWPCTLAAVYARRTGRCLRGARSAEPAKPVLPCQGPVALRALRRCSAAAPLHHRKFGLLPARRAQDINARVNDTLPEVIMALKSKSAQRCAEVVIVGRLLWKFLEIEGGNSKLHRKRCKPGSNSSARGSRFANRLFGNREPQFFRRVRTKLTRKMGAIARAHLIRGNTGRRPAPHMPN